MSCRGVSVGDVMMELKDENERNGTMLYRGWNIYIRSFHFFYISHMSQNNKNSSRAIRDIKKYKNGHLALFSHKIKEK